VPHSRGIELQRQLAGHYRMVTYLRGGIIEFAELISPGGRCDDEAFSLPDRYRRRTAAGKKDQPRQWSLSARPNVEVYSRTKPRDDGLARSHNHQPKRYDRSRSALPGGRSHRADRSWLSDSELYAAKNSKPADMADVGKIGSEAMGKLETTITRSCAKVSRLRCRRWSVPEPGRGKILYRLGLRRSGRATDGKTLWARRPSTEGQCSRRCHGYNTVERRNAR
jgi:hypothetical protein